FGDLVFPEVMLHAKGMINAGSEGIRRKRTSDAQSSGKRAILGALTSSDKMIDGRTRSAGFDALGLDDVCRAVAERGEGRHIFRRCRDPRFQIAPPRRKT